MGFAEKVWRAAAWACLALMSGCVSNNPIEDFTADGPYWPPAPQVPRVAYLGEFSSAADLSISEGFWQSLVSLTTGPKSNALVRPVDVATSQDGQVIYVSDPDAGCVHRFDRRRRVYRCLTVESGNARIMPIGLAVTEDGTVIVSDSLQGTLWTAGPKDKRLEQFFVSRSPKRPTGLHWSSAQQRLYVTDTSEQTVLEYDGKGNFKRSIGIRGNGDGQFNYPIYVWMDAANDLLVSDSLNFRVQRLADDGTFIRAFGENGDRPGDFSRPKGVATDSQGNVYVVDALMHTIQIFNAQGEFLLSVGEQGQAAGQFWLPNGIFITGDNRILVADAYNKRVQVFKYVGPGT